MPFLTEELWQELPPSIKPSPLLISAEWPKEIIFSSSKIEEKFNLLRQIVQTIRHIKACLNIPISHKLPWLFFDTKDKEKAELIAEYPSYIKYLANIEGEIKKVEEKPKNITSAEGYVQGVYLYLPLPESISWEKEKSRLNLRKTKLEKELDNIERRLSSPPFLKNAPSEHIINLKNKKSELNEELTIISTLLGSNL
jgi:valyl-tRNA synthetase